MSKWEATIELTSRVVVTDLAIRACPKCEAMFLESMSKDRLDQHSQRATSKGGGSRHALQPWSRKAWTEVALKFHKMGQRPTLTCAKSF